MAPQTLVKRVERLEARVTVLEQLPARVDELTSQISHLRKESRDEFSAVRRELRALHEDLIDRLKLLYEGRDPGQPPMPRPGRTP